MTPQHRLWNKRVKILARRNLKMSGGKLAAQSVHAVLGLAALMEASPSEVATMGNMTCVVLDASDQKFRQAQEALEEAGEPFYVFADAGYTEVEKNTVTCLAFLETDPREVERADS